jgi:hypothetical protein
MVRQTSARSRRSRAYSPCFGGPLLPVTVDFQSELDREIGHGSPHDVPAGGVALVCVKEVQYPCNPSILGPAVDDGSCHGLFRDRQIVRRLAVKDVVPEAFDRNRRRRGMTTGDEITHGGDDAFRGFAQDIGQGCSPFSMVAGERGAPGQLRIGDDSRKSLQDSGRNSPTISWIPEESTRQPIAIPRLQRSQPVARLLVSIGKPPTAYLVERK